MVRSELVYFHQRKILNQRGCVFSLRNTSNDSCSEVLDTLRLVCDILTRSVIYNIMIGDTRHYRSGHKVF